MIQRVITTLIAVPLLIYVLWYAPPFLFNSLVVLFTFLGIREFQTMAEKLGSETTPWLGWLGGIGVSLGFWMSSHETVVSVLAAGMAVALIYHMVARHPVETAMMSVATTVAGIVYVAVFLGYLISLRMIEGGTTRLSAQLLSFFLLVNWGGDSLAMLTGRRWGRHRLLPVVSPKKTVEGALGGLAGSAAGAIVGHVWFFPEMKLSHALLLAVVMGSVGQVGDWCESLLKRGSRMKDTSAVLPGHGGVLDRLDSLLFNAPLLYYYYRLFWMS